jgi:hypothetical protein
MKIVGSARARAFLLLVGVAALLVLAIGTPVAAGRTADDKAKVFAPDARPYGKSYSEWAAAWWQWVLGQPAATNPVLDTSGALCANNQQGPVWFLAGTFGGSVERTCTVPRGKALLLPVLNNVYCAFAFDPTGTIPPDPPEQRTEEFVRNAARFTATALGARIDGQAVPDLERFFEQSSLFRMVLPAGNLFGLPEGFVLDPCADQGYYLIVKPLPVGTHRIEFGGTSTFPNGSSVTIAARYSIIVEG